MIEHVSIGVRDLSRAIAFYDAVLAPLELVRGVDWPSTPEHPFTSAGYGPPEPDPVLRENKSVFHLEQRPDATPAGPGFHICFKAQTRFAVREFHRIGLIRGAADYGAPGLRAHYTPAYYGAFLVDTEGWRIEAMTYAPEA